jgi:dihydroorotase
MKVLIKNALIIHNGSPYHNMKKDILISNGKIIRIDSGIEETGTVIRGKKLMASVGWFDMRANFSDPGQEHKEDILTGCEAAAAGGFTGVALLPNTKPSIQSKNDISYVLSKATGCLTDIYPYGSVTKDNKGEEITEMIDQHHAGAVAFTDGENPIWNSDIMLKALLYVEKFKGLIIDVPKERWLNLLGHMHEGHTSTILGTKGLPGIAEEIMIERDLRILEYAGGKLHFSNISTGESVKLIKKAKKEGLDVTCDIAAHQIAFNDSDLIDFDTNLKVNPPFREEKDIKALIKGLENGTIDMIVSSHTPQDTESKVLEFDHADFGITGLQTVLPILVDKLDADKWELFLDKITINPRRRLGLPLPEINVGKSANITVFDPTVEWIFDETTNRSKSLNSPFLGKKLNGKVLAVFNKGKERIFL